jgi:hypothetical protein
MAVVGVPPWVRGSAVEIWIPSAALSPCLLAFVMKGRMIGSVSQWSPYFGRAVVASSASPVVR